MSNSKVTQLLVVTIVFLAITAILVPLRLYTRLVISKSFGYDDAIIVLCTAFHLAMTVIIFLGCKSGVGRHALELDLPEVIDAVMYTRFTGLTYMCLTSCVKACVGLALLRIANFRRFIYTLWAALVLDLVACIITIYFALSDCKPISYSWERLSPQMSGSCRDQKVFTDVGYAASATSIFLDVLFVIIPCLVIWDLQMNKRLKITAIAIMSLGILASVATIIRLKYLVILADTEDPTYGVADAIIWSVVEGGTGIAAACIMTLRPLMRKLNIMRFLNSSNSRSTTGFSNNSRPMRLSEWPRNSKSGVDAGIEHRGTSCGSEKEILGKERMRKSSSEAAGNRKLF